MVYLYLVAMSVMAVLTTVWAAVQMARRRAFPDASSEEDLLAGRTGCGACPRHVDCEPTSEH